MLVRADTPPEDAPQGDDSKSIPGRHDRIYRLFFSYPEMVQDALTGFIHEPWVDQLDFSTLEKMADQRQLDLPVRWPRSTSQTASICASRT